MSFHSKRSVIDEFDRAREANTKKWRDTLPTWCPGCGHFSALQGLYEALDTLGVPGKDFVLVSGIGCSGRFPFFIKGFGFHALHGRAIPVATGIKIANPKLKVVVVGGDGDGIGIGGGHFPHAARNNLDITYILLDNSIYGLTKGQISPTSPLGMKSATSPYGNIARPLNPAVLALTYGSTFVGRAFSKDRQGMAEMITEALTHPGFSFVHCLSPCVEFNKTITYKSVTDDVSPLPCDYLPDNRIEAIEAAGNIDTIHLGVFFKENVPTFDENVEAVKIKLKETND